MQFMIKVDLILKLHLKQAECISSTTGAFFFSILSFVFLCFTYFQLFFCTDNCCLSLCKKTTQCEEIFGLKNETQDFHDKTGMEKKVLFRNRH